MKYTEWTQDQLEKMISEKRKIKSLIRRKGKNGIAIKALSRKIAEKSGFTKKDVYTIMQALCEVMMKELQEKKYIKINDIFTIHPMLKRARQGTCLKGGKSAEQMIVPPYWEIKVMMNDYMSRLMRNLNVTEEEINNLYEN